MCRSSSLSGVCHRRFFPYIPDYQWYSSQSWQKNREWCRSALTSSQSPAGSDILPRHWHHRWCEYSGQRWCGSRPLHPQQSTVRLFQGGIHKGQSHRSIFLHGLSAPVRPSSVSEYFHALSLPPQKGQKSSACRNLWNCQCRLPHKSDWHRNPASAARNSERQRHSCQTGTAWTPAHIPHRLCSPECLAASAEIRACPEYSCRKSLHQNIHQPLPYLRIQRISAVCLAEHPDYIRPPAWM